MAEINYGDTQGFLFSGYKRLGHASYHLLRFGDTAGAKSWLAGLLGRKRITSGRDRKTDFAMNVAFTASGLDTLGLNRDDLASFEAAFTEGMDEGRRSRVLGDVDDSAPERWDWGHAGANGGAVHVVLMLFARDARELTRRSEAEFDAYMHHGLSQARPPIETDAEAHRQHKTDGLIHEHFGFADGLSQPWIPGVTNEKLGGPPVAVGEFILGLTNAYGQRTAVPNVCKQSFGRNGTYLVFRQLHQDVASFWNAMKSAGGEREEQVAAKALGRWPSGALVTPGADKDPGQATTGDFTFTRTDPQGLGCPFGSHVRRANPRDSIVADTPEAAAVVSGRHRLLRRGRSYGPRLVDRYRDDGRERGLLFLCLNANIERQFEFVQQTWCNNPKFAGAYDELDPIIGALEAGKMGRLRIPSCPVRGHIAGLRRFVIVRGGAYFFLPGLNALAQLAGI